MHISRRSLSRIALFALPVVVFASDQARYPDDTSKLIEVLHDRIKADSKEIIEADMKPYSTTIPNTDVRFDMVPIAGGKFRRGSGEGESGRKPDEGPVRELEIAPFWMGKCEVTWDEYQLFVDHEEEKAMRAVHKPDPAQQTANKDADAVAHPTLPYHDMSFGMGKDGFPANSMTQHGANKYCEWLSAKTGHFYRLPTEAEWEYAARAGTTTAYFWGDDPAAMNDYCWWGWNSDFTYKKVGRKKPNPWGLHDMLGNVAEWTLDQYDPAFYANAPALDPWNKATRPYPHSVRGGSCEDDKQAPLRCAARTASSPEWKALDPQLPRSIWHLRSNPFVGFRLVRPLKVPTARQMDTYWNSGV